MIYFLFRVSEKENKSPIRCEFFFRPSNMWCVVEMKEENSMINGNIFDFRFSSLIWAQVLLWVYSFSPIFFEQCSTMVYFYIGLAIKKATSWQKLAYCSHIPFSWTTITTKPIKWNRFLFTKMSIIITNHTATIDRSLSRTAPSTTKVLIQYFLELVQNINCSFGARNVGDVNPGNAQLNFFLF